MKYKNKITGEVIDFTCTIKSNTWELCESKAPKALDEENEKPVRKTSKKDK